MLVGNRIADKIDEIERSFREALDGFDPDSCDSSELSSLLLSLGKIERLCSCTRAIVASSLSKNHKLKSPSDRSDAHGLARMENIPIGQAKQILSTGNCLSSHPIVKKEALNGSLSSAQLHLIADTVEVVPSAESKLVEAAKSGGLSDLKQTCMEIKQKRINPDIQRSRIHSRRYFRCYTDTDGMRHLRVGGNPEDLVYLEAAVELRRKYIFDDAYGRRESFEAYGFDGFMEVVGEGIGGGNPPPACHGKPPKPSYLGSKIIVRIDHSALMRGYATEDEVSEISGVGPVAPSVVVEMMRKDDPFIGVVLTKGEEVLSVAHLGRKPNALQITALEWMYPTCAVKGCPHTLFLEMDHRIPWADIHKTALGNLDRLCSFHHALKTNANWQLVEGTAKRDFVSPDDPRHPGYHPEK